MPLILSALGEVDDRVAGLQAGGLGGGFRQHLRHQRPTPAVHAEGAGEVRALKVRLGKLGPSQADSTPHDSTKHPTLQDDSFEAQALEDQIGSRKHGRGNHRLAELRPRKVRALDRPVGHQRAAVRAATVQHGHVVVEAHDHQVDVELENPPQHPHLLRSPQFLTLGGM